ncbi:MAG: FmdB family zinc ribbon protein [Terriglobales bacterium]
MPLYEYQCRRCKHRFERIRKFSDRALRTCPECGGRLEQLVSASAVQFKGSGWYVTDYPVKGRGKSAAGGESGAGEASKPEEKAEAKPKSEPATKKSHDKKK